MLETLLKLAVEASGYELWGYQLLKQGKHSLLRVYIDHTKGIDVDDCARASHQISGMLAVENPIRGEYTLEVSSPGLDRPLFTLEQYKKYIDHKIKLRLKIPHNGQRNFQGIIKKIESEKITIDDNHFLFEDIEKANVIPHFGDEG